MFSVTMMLIHDQYNRARYYAIFVMWNGGQLVALSFSGLYTMGVNSVRRTLMRLHFFAFESKYQCV